MFSRFNATPACDRQMDGEMDVLQQHSPRCVKHRAVKNHDSHSLCYSSSPRRYWGGLCGRLERVNSTTQYQHRNFATRNQNSYSTQGL